MILYQEAKLVAISAHQIGSKTLDQGCNFSSSGMALPEPELQSEYLRFILGSFTQPEFFSLNPDESVKTTSELFSAAREIFGNQNSLHAQSEQLGALLYELTSQPQVKAGYFLMAYFTGIQLDEQLLDAIGLYKLDQTDSFIKPVFKGKNCNLLLEQGFPLDKPDYACLILNTNAENGFKVMAIEKSSRGSGHSYWKEDFLGLRSFNDAFHHTRNFLTLARSFVSDVLPEEFEVNRTDQIDYLNRSLGYFKSNERFDEEEFKRDVFNSPEVIESFNEYKKSYEDAGDFELSSQFEISSPAVKKQSRIFKSVLKLDRNFHIYVHGDRELIERGVEPDGRKFYKIYYEEEN